MPPPPRRIRADPTAQFLLEGIVERESGRTPGPPVVPLWVVVTVVVLIFLVGLALALFVVPHLSPAGGCSLRPSFCGAAV